MRIPRLPAIAAPVAVTLAALVLSSPASQAQPAAEPASRAARDAENPMRMIIEASKLKVRIRPDNDPTDAGAADKRAAPAAPKPAATKVAAPARPASAVQAKAPGAASQAVAAVPPADAPSPAPSAPPETIVAKAVESPAAALAMPPPLLPVARPAPLAPLKLTRMVEPSLRESQLSRMRSDVEVVVGFTVNTDGSVSNVIVRSSPMPAFDAAIVEAINQWRYQPVDEPRSHGVQLVLRKPQ
jgi:TonB family protein